MISQLQNEIVLLRSSNSRLRGIINKLKEEVMNNMSAYGGDSDKKKEVLKEIESVLASSHVASSAHSGKETNSSTVNVAN